jgi:hypothetical protein
LIVMGSAWLLRARLGTPSVDPTVTTAKPPRSDTPLEAPRPSPIVLAISLSPTSVRGADDTPRVTIPSGTDRVLIHLQSDGASQTFPGGRAVVNTVSGREVWSGPAASEAPTQPPAFARIELPADRLPADDYVVTLFEQPTTGQERERFKFFLRVRAR